MKYSRAEILQSCGWEHPQYYIGYSPKGEILAMSIHRDSTIMEKSNWEVLKKRIDFEKEGQEYAYEWEASHCFVGWVRYLMIKTYAPDEVLNAFMKSMDDLESYPILDEEHYSNMRMEELSEYLHALPYDDIIEMMVEEDCVETLKQEPDLTDKTPECLLMLLSECGEIDKIEQPLLDISFY